MSGGLRRIEDVNFAGGVGDSGFGLLCARPLEDLIANSNWVLRLANCAVVVSWWRELQTLADAS